jgi:predicted transcriptional regulator
MNKIIPGISKQLYKEDTLSVLDSKYSVLGPIWVSHQMEWLNGIYACFKDHDKFLIIIFLTQKTLDFYSHNFTKINFDEFFANETIEIERFNISEISSELQIPKESARRKILELENEGVIKKNKKKLIIDRSCFTYSKPIKSIKRISTFLSTLSTMCNEEKILSKKWSSDELESVIKDNFSHIWNLYYELQIPMMTAYKKIFKDFETFHIFGTCVVNQHYYARKLMESHMGRDKFLIKLFSTDSMLGINAMSVSDITGIPRATTTRKLQKLVKQKTLAIDEKKLYKLTGKATKVLKPIQKKVLISLANFSTKIYNLALLDKNNNVK